MDKSSMIGIEILRNIGFDFPNGEQEIPTGSEKSADFLVSCNGLKVIVEVKLKTVDKEKKLRREEILNSGNIYIDESEKYINNSINTIVRESNKQLRKSSENIPSDFNILLFIGTGYNSHINTEQLKNLLYGKVDVVAFPEKILFPCYSYNHSDFLRRESIDCVIIAEIKNYTEKVNIENFDINNFEIYFCLNPYSERYSKIKECDFIRNNFSRVIDIKLEIDNGNAFILEGSDWEKIKKSGQDYKKIEEFGIVWMSKRVQVLSEKYRKNLIPFTGPKILPTFTMRIENTPK